MILSFDTFKGRFNYRVAGIAIWENRILLNRLETDSHWFLPGGRVELGEPSPQALEREIFEEIGAKIQINRLQFLVENFFEYSRKKFHELGFYYTMEVFLPHEKIEFLGEENHHKMIYRWFSQEELLNLNFQPNILKDKLFSPEWEEFHIIQRE